MKKNQNYKIWTSCILFTAGFLMIFIANKIPAFAEWYAISIYPMVAGSISRFSGMFPWSLVEIVLYLGVITLLVTVVRFITKLLQKREWRSFGKKAMSNIVLTGGVLFFLFVINCGINYQRESFSESEDMKTRTYTAKELAEVSIYLAEQVNKESELVKRREDGTMILPDEAEYIATEAMKQASESFLSLEGYYPRPKGLLLPEILSYQNITGIYAPFTVEANYNSDITDYNVPFTMCHELSHLRGFMQEQEANFIAYLACAQSEEETFRYSGNLLAFIYCTNVLREENYELYEEVRAALSESVEADLKSNREFWVKYDGRIAEVSTQINDTYLKANGQSDGVESYDRMVDLLVSQYDMIKSL